MESDVKMGLAAPPQCTGLRPELICQQVNARDGRTVTWPRVCNDARNTALASSVTSTEEVMNNMPDVQRVVRWYPPAYDIRVEDAPIPR